MREGKRCGHVKTQGTCREVLGRFPALRIFARMPGVEPPNHLAERQGCHVYRKVCLGTHSERGSRFVESLLTAGVTPATETGRAGLPDADMGCTPERSQAPVAAIRRQAPGNCLIPHERIQNVLTLSAPAQGVLSTDSPLTRDRRKGE